MEGISDCLLGLSCVGGRCVEVACGAAELGDPCAHLDLGQCPTDSFCSLEGVCEAPPEPSAAGESCDPDTLERFGLDFCKAGTYCDRESRRCERPAVLETQACARAGVGGAVILSAGFGEAGEDGTRLEPTLRDHIEGSDLRVLGPNCLGVLSPHHDLNASFVQASALPGNIAFASQSGALCTSMLDWAREAGVGFSHFVSLGNMVEVDFGDLLEMFADDEKTRAVVLYVESVKNAQKLLLAARRCAASKPVLACNSGRFAASTQAASSHTGAMTGEDAVFAAAFRRAGIERALHVGELFGAAQLLARYTRAAGPRLAIVTNAGGPGVLATDAVVERGAKLAELSGAPTPTSRTVYPPTPLARILSTYWETRTPGATRERARPS